MKFKYSSLIKLSKPLLVILLIVTTLALPNIFNNKSINNLIVTCNNSKDNAIVTDTDAINPTNVNISISYSLSLADNVKETDINIIKAARQAILDYYCYNAKFTHYDDYVINNNILITDVIETKKILGQFILFQNKKIAVLILMDIVLLL